MLETAKINVKNFSVYNTV